MSSLQRRRHNAATTTATPAVYLTFSQSGLCHSHSFTYTFHFNEYVNMICGKEVD